MVDSFQGPDAAAVEELLAHRRFLRLLASNLVRDEHRAEDLVQDTWLKALESPPQPAASPAGNGSLRGWLGRVLRNRAINEGQREAQRGQRERDAGSDLGEPDFAEVEAELDMQRQVVESLQGLREPYRTTLYMRYYRELGPSRIAELQGVPVKTVKTRLTRGLEEMRQVLDRQAGGKREDWALLLLPLVRGAELPLAPTGVELAAAPAGTAALGVKLLFGAAALTLLGAGLRQLVEGAAATPGEQVGESEAASKRGSALERAPSELPKAIPLAAARHAIPSASRAPANRLPLLTGRVVNYAGQAIPEARVRLLVLRTNSPDKVPSQETVDVDLEGVFQLPAAWIGVLALEVRAPGFTTLYRDALGLGQDQQLGDLRMDRGQTLWGQVVDSMGLPLAGAQVEARGPFSSFRKPRARGRSSVLTDADGHFRLPGQPLGPWDLSIRAAGYLTELVAGSGNKLAQGQAPLWIGELELVKGEPLRGRVGKLPPEFNSLEQMTDLRVRLRSIPSSLAEPSKGERFEDARVGADGSFRLQGLELSAEYLLSLVATEGTRNTTIGRTRATGGDEFVSLEWDGKPLRWLAKTRPGSAGEGPKGTAALEVYVGDAEGQPLENQLVALRAMVRELPGEESFRVTDERGLASWVQLSAAHHQVRVLQPGTLFPTRGFGVTGSALGGRLTLQEGERKRIDLSVKRLACLAGQVRQEGLALPGALLTLRSTSASAERSAGPKVARADSEGRFEWESLEPGSYQLVVRHAARQLPTAFELQIITGFQERSFDLYSASLRGRAVDAAGRGLAGVRIEPRSMQPGEQRTSFRTTLTADFALTDAEGFFELEGLDPGRQLRLIASAPGRARTRSAPLELGAGEERQGIEFRMELGASVVLSLQGEPADKRQWRGGFFLRATPIDEVLNDVMGFAAWDGEWQRGHRLSLEGLPAGAYWIQLYTKGRQQPEALGAPQKVQLEAGALLELDWVL